MTRGRSTADAITVELKGGLGNQLFQYALGRELSWRWTAPLILDSTRIQSTSAEEFPLDTFASQYSTSVYLGAEPTRLKTQLQERLQRYFQRLTRIRFPGTLTERGHDFDERVLSAPKGSYLKGYFQSWKYFRNVGDAIRNELRQVKEPSSWFVSEVNRMEASECVVAIHVRRGDYLNLRTRRFHGVLDKSYYSRALMLLGPGFESCEFWVFSDEPDSTSFIHELVGTKRFVRSIYPPIDSKPIESLVLMSKSHHLISANSSFSWWAAYLGEQSGRTVVVPGQWFRALPIKQTDRFLPTWKIVS